MKRNLKVLKTGLTAMGFAAALSACGQGPHLVGPAAVAGNAGAQIDSGHRPGPRISPIIEANPEGTTPGTTSPQPQLPNVLVPAVVTTIPGTGGTPTTPGTVTPGTPTTPGTVTPGTPGTPGTVTPGTVTPGTPTTPGTVTPGTPTTPGTVTPGTPSTGSSDTPSTVTPGTPGNGSNGTGGTSGQNGRDGSNGANGQNGRDGCGSRLFTANFPARPMTAEELRSSELPYRSTSAIKIPAHQIGDSNHQTRNGIKYVRDAQLVFAVDATLPFKASVVSLKEFSIEMSLSKLPTETQRGHAIYLDTEILCLLDAKRCSGKIYTDRDFLPNINPLFFGSNGKVSSDAFTKLVLENATTVPGLAQKLYSSDRARVDLKQAFPDVNMAEYLYGESRPSEDPHFVDRVLRLAVADDTFVSSATVTVKMIVNTCADAQAK